VELLDEVGRVVNPEVDAEQAEVGGERRQVVGARGERAGVLVDGVDHAGGRREPVEQVRRRRERR
jgi:hypothetical protein